MKVCIFGGQYGSEGKGAVSEYYALTQRSSDLLIVAGENAPNSGHTCSLGKTQNLPAASFYADAVILGPDSMIDPGILMKDMASLYARRGKMIEVHIHEHAGIIHSSYDRHAEEQVVANISSTGSGSGFARFAKCFHRFPDRTIAGFLKANNMSLDQMFGEFPVRILNRFQFLQLIRTNRNADWIFECSQGALLDVNWGIYPWVTSRSTLPRVALARNGLDGMDWKLVGVYRTYPIRTGGPSGPTGGKEIQFSDLGVEPEIATVTKRTRRIFEFDREDFSLSIQLTDPYVVAFTHVDYLKHWTTQEGRGPDMVLEFIRRYGISAEFNRRKVIASHIAGQFYNVI